MVEEISLTDPVQGEDYQKLYGDGEVDLNQEGSHTVGSQLLGFNTIYMYYVAYAICTWIFG